MGGEERGVRDESWTGGRRGMIRLCWEVLCVSVHRVCLYRRSSLQPSLTALLCSPVQCTEKLRMKESHIAQLSNTVERMLKESDDRIRAVAEERRTMMAEKVGVHTHIRTYGHASIHSCLSMNVCRMPSPRKLLCWTEKS